MFLLHTLQGAIFPAPPSLPPFFSFSLFGLMGRCSVIEVEPQNSRTSLAFPSTPLQNFMSEIMRPAHIIGLWLRWYPYLCQVAILLFPCIRLNLIWVSPKPLASPSLCWSLDWYLLFITLYFLIIFYF